MGKGGFLRPSAVTEIKEVGEPRDGALGAWGTRT